MGIRRWSEESASFCICVVVVEGSCDDVRCVNRKRRDDCNALSRCDVVVMATSISSGPSVF